MTHSKIFAGFVLISGLLAACSSDDTSPAAPNTGTGGSMGTGGGAGASGASGSTAGNAGTMPSDGGCVHPKYAHCNPDGGYTCPTYVPDVCNDTCVNMKTDPDYCGGCMTKCGATATCTSGTCGAEPTALVAAAPGCEALHLAFANNNVYWTDKGHNTVKGIPAAGGAAFTVASGQSGPIGLLIDSGTAYWINSTNNTVMKASLSADAGTPTVLVSGGDAGASGITTITVFSGTLYFGAPSGLADAGMTYGIFKVPTAGGTPVLIGLTQQNGNPGALAVDATLAYYTTTIHNDVEFMNLTAMGDAGVGFNFRDGTDIQQKTYRVAESQGSLLADTIQVIGTKVYWANGGVLSQGKADGLRMPQTAATTASSGNVTGFVIGTTNSYFGEDGFVEKAALMGPEAGVAAESITVARAQPLPNSFVLDTTNVYWATASVATDAGTDAANACAIMKLAQ
jgi:hypothetical protein